MNKLLLGVLAAGALLACRSTPATPAQPAPSAAPPSPIRDGGILADAFTPPVVPANVGLAPHGTPLVDVAHGVTVAFLGGDRAHVARVTVAPAGQPARTMVVEGWPTGVRVRYGALNADATEGLVLVDTVRALNRAPGLHSLIALHGTASSWTAEAASLSLQRAAQNAHSEADVRALLGGAPVYVESERCRPFARSAATMASLTRVVDAGGVSVFDHWQDGLVTMRASAPSLTVVEPALRERVREAVKAQGEGSCGAEAIELTGTGAAMRVRSVRVAAPAYTGPRGPTPRTLTPIAERPMSDTMSAFVQSAFVGEPTVVGNAPLTPHDGNVAVLRVEASEPSVVVIEEDSVFRVLPLGRAVNINDDRVTAVRFVDANTDGRADVVVETTIAAGDEAHARGVGHRGLYLVPSESVGATLRYDLASLPTLARAASLDEGVAALGSVVWMGVSAREACAVVGATRTFASTQRVATTPWAVLQYEEPGAFGWRPTLRTAGAEFPAGEYGGAVVSCRNLSCDSERMVCTGTYDEPGPGGTAYWFVREGAALRLAVVGVYNGS